MDLNPYKCLGGGSLDQALFKKSQQQVSVTTPPTSETDKSIVSNFETLPSTLPKKARQQVSDTQKRPNHTSSSSAGNSIATRKFIKRTFDLYEDRLN